MPRNAAIHRFDGHCASRLAHGRELDRRPVYWALTRANLAVVVARAPVAGGSNLSIYLGQSIILSTIFSGYGLGLWGVVGRLTAVAIAIAVTVALIVALSIWRIRFERGLFEWVLRRITYGRLRG